MSDVVIERCVLRIRRLGGWSWGPRPEALLAAATRALPRLIAARLAELPSTSGDGRVDAPVHVRIPLRFEELMSLATIGEGDAVDGAIATRVADAIAAALEAPLVAATRVGSPNSPASATSTSVADVPSDRVRPPAAAPSRLVRTLIGWVRDGLLEAIVGALAPADAASWRGTIASVARAPGSEGAVALDHGTREAILSRLAAFSVHTADHRWLIALAILVADHGRDPGARTTADETAALAGIPAPDEVEARHATAVAEPDRERAQTRPAPVAVPSATGGPTGVSAARAPGRRSVGSEVRISSALPFLVLVPLARSGWLDALGAILTAPDLANLGPGLAAGIAYKVLPPPERGWHHDASARAVAAALAGVDAVPDPLVHALTRHEDRLCGALDGFVTATLVRGHARGSSLVLHRGARDYLLLDTDGMFVIAASPRLESLIAAARGMDELILVPAATATPQVLDRLELGNLRFVTDGPTVGSEPWRRVAADRWSNDGATPAKRLAALAHDLPTHAELAVEVDAALWSERPAIPRAVESAIERTLTSAAAMALGDLSWRLFHARERSTPMLALSRFADLEATVRTGSDAIEVRIPLGRRHADLFFHGFMTTIPGVPWLDGRTVELMGG